MGEGNSLTIYAQSKAENAIGKLTAVSDYNGAGIGAGSMVTISGGAVTVQSSKGADIGGGFDAVNSNIAQSDKIEISEDATVTRPDGNALNIGPAEHQAKDEWAFDSTRHWHLCKAADCTENHQFNKAAHTPGDWIVDQAAATTETGRRHKECTACGYIMQTEAILPVHSHSYEQGWKSDASGRWHECACGDKSGCADHSFGKWTTDIPAASTTPGSRHRDCSICQYRQTDAIPPVHSHSYGQGWESDASGRWHECACGDKSGCTDHSFGAWTTDTPATSATPGSRHRECTLCQYQQT